MGLFSTLKLPYKIKLLIRNPSCSWQCCSNGQLVAESMLFMFMKIPIKNIMDPSMRIFLSEILILTEEQVRLSGPIEEQITRLFIYIKNWWSVSQWCLCLSPMTDTRSLLRISVGKLQESPNNYVHDYR